MWRNLQWVPPGTVLASPSLPCESLLVVVRGEAQAVLGCSGYLPLLPAGSFLCEANLLGRFKRIGQLDPPLLNSCLAENWGDPTWPLRGKVQIPPIILDIISEFLTTPSSEPHFYGRVFTTLPSLVTSLSRRAFLQCLSRADDPGNVPDFDGMRITSDVLRNVRTIGSSERELGLQDIAALRIVCEGPVSISCASFGNVVRSTVVPSAAGVFGHCMGRQPIQS